MTQHDLIETYLQHHTDITPMEAYSKLGITKLATRISEMKSLGYKFYDSWIETTNRFGIPCRYKRYVLLQRPRGKK